MRLPAFSAARRPKRSPNIWRSGDDVLLAPPFLVIESELDEIVELLARSIDEAIATLDPGSR
jgi:adenosylmethionine-8-amino-7-oxononanoate aminotransferase